MDQQRLFWGMVAIIGPNVSIIAGIIIGAVRYKKYGREMKEKIDEQYREAQEKGGISSLYYKHTGKRLFQKSFGVPMLIGFLAGLGLMCLAFHFL